MGSELILILVVVGGLAFDFTNGFHDTANAVATWIATGSLKPRVAVLMRAWLNFAGAFISISVATIATGMVNPKVLAGGDGLVLVLAALLGAMMWNLITCVVVVAVAAVGIYAMTQKPFSAKPKPKVSAALAPAPTTFAVRSPDTG
jgi:phosphate/sulfate permease